MNRLAALCAVAVFAGCASPQPITNQPGSAVLKAAENTTIGKQLVADWVDTAYNNNQAVSIGVLSATDPVVGCANDAVTLLGYDPQTGQPLAPPGGLKSFTPKVVGPFSFGSVVYINLQQLQASGGLNSVPSLTEACYAVIGKITWHTAWTAAQGVLHTVLGPLGTIPGFGVGQAVGVLPKLP